MAPFEIRHRSVRPISAKHAQASRFLQQSPLARSLRVRPMRNMVQGETPPPVFRNGGNGPMNCAGSQVATVHRLEFVSRGRSNAKWNARVGYLDSRTDHRIFADGKEKGKIQNNKGRESRRRKR